MTDQDQSGKPLRAALQPAVADSWDILTSREGARLWLEAEHHSGIEVGAAIPIRGVGAAKVTAVRPEGQAFDLRVDGGAEATVELRSTKNDASEIVVSGPAAGPDPAPGWNHLLQCARAIVNRAVALRRPRQAIVVIHGIGNQRPLTTVRRFTDAIVERDKRWSKPDQLSSSYELRRFQLARTTRRPRTDVYELYWADKVPGTVVGHIVRWVRGQLVRRPRDVSPALRPILYATAFLVGLAAAGIAYLLVTAGVQGVSDVWRSVTGLAGLSVLGGLVSAVLVKTVGDAARYLDDDPENIAVRQSIREEGLALLRRLHAEQGYDRVVLVGHSLGSVIAYDIVRQLWSETCSDHGWPLDSAQPQLRAYSKALESGATPTRDAQKALWEENRRVGMPWLVTDLVTVGSPLTHARSLLATSARDLEACRDDLELPTCPPRIDDGHLTERASYVVADQTRTLSLLTYGCPFAPTRWTNLYAPVRGAVFGDLVGGPIAPEFGLGVADVPVTVTPWWRRRTLLAHTAYWRSPDAPSVTSLLAAVDLDSAPWLDRHVQAIPWSLALRSMRSELRQHLEP